MMNQKFRFVSSFKTRLRSSKRSGRYWEMVTPHGGSNCLNSSPYYPFFNIFDCKGIVLNMEYFSHFQHYYNRTTTYPYIPYIPLSELKEEGVDDPAISFEPENLEKISLILYISKSGFSYDWRDLEEILIVFGNYKDSHYERGKIVEKYDNLIEHSYGEQGHLRWSTYKVDNLMEKIQEDLDQGFRKSSHRHSVIRCESKVKIFNHLIVTDEFRTDNYCFFSCRYDNKLLLIPQHIASDKKDNLKDNFQLIRIFSPDHKTEEIKLMDEIILFTHPIPRSKID